MIYEKIIIIGDSTGDNICSAVHVFELKGEHSIAENSVSYWCSCLIFGYELKIYKSTKESIKLEHMISSGYPLEKVLLYLNSLVIKKMSTKEIISQIKSLEEDKYSEGVEHGREKIQKEMKNLLGILETF